MPQLKQITSRNHTVAYTDHSARFSPWPIYGNNVAETSLDSDGRVLGQSIG